ncbi:hypothetical protein CDAR_494051 [Caerostris darwini]|uniref:Uncharacterized protein n=1 Tax=Caerostris darwini TaxID=1538125 RepID=A0AAV4VUQ0_9ARAC|nr:hypothetical protein CDAR_494051 [Caerostris darwini]
MALFHRTLLNAETKYRSTQAATFQFQSESKQTFVVFCSILCNILNPFFPRRDDSNPKHGRVEKKGSCFYLVFTLSSAFSSQKRKHAVAVKVELDFYFLFLK